jgi:hypothetical protein
MKPFTYESSQKLGADPLVNPGQKRPDESSSAGLPQNIEMIPTFTFTDSLPLGNLMEDIINIMNKGSGSNP